MTTTKPRVLQIGRLLPWLESRLAADYELHRLADEADPQAFLAARGAEFVGLVTSAGGTGANAALIDALPSLRVISSFGVGLDKIDLAAAARRGIAVGYTPDVLNDCVADLAMALLLDVARRTPEADRHVRAGRWGAPGVPAFPLGRRVSGAKLGIVGLGRIGRTIARRALGFDMAIRYHARRPPTRPGRTSPRWWRWRAGPTSWSSSPPGAPARATSSTRRCSTRSAPKASSSTFRAAPSSTRRRW